MSANRFVLKHHRVEVEYNVGITPGIPALVYHDGSAPPKSYTETEITTENTALGELVSVPLVPAVDVGGERFGFFLPQFDVPRGESVEFITVGVYYQFTGPDSVPHRPPSWEGIEMRGTAQTVIHELTSQQ